MFIVYKKPKLFIFRNYFFNAAVFQNIYTTDSLTFIQILFCCSDFLKGLRAIKTIFLDFLGLLWNIFKCLEIFVKLPPNYYTTVLVSSHIRIVDWIELK